MNNKYLKNVVTLELEASKCTGCGMCTQVCPHNVFLLSNRKAEIVNRDSCMECGACARNCRFEAISVNAGVGCAAAVIQGIITGKEPSCDCSGPEGSSCC